MDTIGPYDVVRELGAGGMGTVHEARHRTLGRIDAVKVPHPHLVADQQALRRFQREAQAIERVQHPHVAKLRDANIESRPPYIAMEFLAGESLADRLRGGRVLHLDDVVALLTPIASALDACHDAGVVHRDVKPSNILLETQPRGVRPVLTDFGIVQVAEASPLTGTGPLGTYLYLSPEQAAGREASAASDLYALACVAFQCLTGTTPFPSTTVDQLLAAHRTGQPPRASMLNPALDAGVDDVLVRGLAKKPQERLASWPTCAAFAEGLATIGRHAPPASPRTAVLPPRSVPGPIPRRSRASVLAAALVTLLAGPTAYLVADRVVDRGTDPPISTGITPDAFSAALKVDVKLTREQEALLRGAPYERLLDCAPDAELLTKNLTVALKCSTRWSDAPELLLFRSDPDLLAEVMDSPDRQPGKCSERSGVDSTWNGGPLACYLARPDGPSASARAAIWWGYPDGMSMIAVSGSDKTGPLFAWWNERNWSTPRDVEPTAPPD